ncbi:adenosylhomocysteinase [Nordella sp. HKS 07]|uniref:adenosylhomocysteinase n=1 Tax=Nordella sp. HKS 07 TaxID=2712222 RepID=UPI0013E1F43D|nr:adenosylhomocysteinase [Nordella sp. HKS 07]QIG51944.1 adenosylhomocysteinase [Nordella sp. HKS 07]
MTVNLAQEGAERIAWAGRGMPVLAAIARRLVESGRVRGKRIGVSLVLEPKTANLALAFKRAGAEVSVYCGGSSTEARVVQALEAQGIAVFAEAGATAARDLELARAFLKTRPDILIDDGASLIRLAHREFPDLVSSMLGAAEETTSGVRPLRAMHEEGALRIPVIAVNDSRMKYLFDNVYGTGQSCVMAFLDITNLQLAGREVLVIGYGWVGKGVAAHAAALGARVTVAELDPVKALQAIHDGHAVKSVELAAPATEVVFASTGIAGVVTEAHLHKLPDGAFLCTAGGGDFELPMDYLRFLGTAKDVRQGVTEYTLPGGARIRVMADGHCINCSGGEGNPIEVMDLSLSLQAIAVEELAGDASRKAPGLYPISEAAERDVALIRLGHEGGVIEPMTEQLATAIRSW